MAGSHLSRQMLYDTYNLSSSHNIKIGKDTINNDPEDDEGNTPYQKNQFAPEKINDKASCF